MFESTGEHKMRGMESLDVFLQSSGCWNKHLRIGIFSQKNYLCHNKTGYDLNFC